MCQTLHIKTSSSLSDREQNNHLFLQSAKSTVFFKVRIEKVWFCLRFSPILLLMSHITFLSDREQNNLFFLQSAKSTVFFKVRIGFHPFNSSIILNGSHIASPYIVVWSRGKLTFFFLRYSKLNSHLIQYFSAFLLNLLGTRNSLRLKTSLWVRILRLRFAR